MVLTLASVPTPVLVSVDMFGFASFPKWASGASGSGLVNCAPEDFPMIGSFSESVCSRLSQACPPHASESNHGTHMRPFHCMPALSLDCASLFAAVEASV